MMRNIVLGCALFCLVGCGHKGPLTLPDSSHGSSAYSDKEKKEVSGDDTL